MLIYNVIHVTCKYKLVENFFFFGCYEIDMIINIFTINCIIFKIGIIFLYVI